MTSLTPFNVWSDFESIFDFAPIYANLEGRAKRNLSPFYEKEDEFVLRVQMPGVKKDNLSIMLESDHLKIKGETTLPADLKEAKLVHGRELKETYEYDFKVSSQIDRDRISGELKDGVLTVVLGKTNRVRPRRISIS